MNESEGPGRLGIVLAMMDGLVAHAFRPDHLDRLNAAGTLLDERPLSDFDSPRALELLAQADVLVGHWGCPTLTEEVMERASRLRLFAYAAGTVKWQVTDAVWDRGVIVTSAAAANARPVAEYTVAAVLLSNKGAFLQSVRLRDPSASVPLDTTAVGNVGKHVGLVGASHVGRLVIELLAPYDLEIAVYDPYLLDADARALGVANMALNELCEWCDVLSLHAPDIPSTRRMIGAAQLSRLRDGVTVINTARPALIDHEALFAELSSGRLAAVLDVTEPEPLPPGSPWRTLPTAFVTPHIAGAMGSELWRMADLAVDEVERFVAGEALRFPVTRADLGRIA